MKTNWKIGKHNLQLINNRFFIDSGLYSQNIFFLGFNNKTKKEIISFEYPEKFSQNQRMKIASIILKYFGVNYRKEKNYTFPKLNYSKRLGRIYEDANFYHIYKQEK